MGKIIINNIILKNLFILAELKARQKVKMPTAKSKKVSLIHKKNAVSFQLIHRSQQVGGRGWSWWDC